MGTRERLVHRLAVSGASSESVGTKENHEERTDPDRVALVAAAIVLGMTSGMAAAGEPSSTEDKIWGVAVDPSVNWPE
ncbi:hypothetical protein [Pseudonocardia hierapolitana]|uniref:hypothetical protein n=1 Tax=Pseudonocardia hierapolitana TaxID=1128676 RepID=UPI0011BD48F4|nr:hypothetical protein [Pseudonocardia hierapolitana]